MSNAPFINWLKTNFSSILYKTPIYNWILDKNLSSVLSNIYIDQWPGNYESGKNLLRGYVNFSGEIVRYSNSIWDKNSASKFWNKELHSFNWIRDLRIIGSNQSRLFTRDSIAEWINKYNKWSGLEWQSNIIGKRIYNILGNFNFFCSSADDGYKEILLESISKQGKHLMNNNLKDVNGFEKIYGIKGIIICSLCIGNFEKYFKIGIYFLLIEIKTQVLTDGTHYLKSPSIHLEFLRNLIDIKGLLSKSKKKVPDEINLTISKMASILKFFRLGNGQLATFNNSKYVKKILIDQVLLRANSKIKVPEDTLTSKFHKISENKLNFLMDCGNPVKENSFAGSLSFEFSYGKNMLVVNCGSPHVYNKKWSQAMKSTAAHSTLMIDNINSSDIFFNNKSSGRQAKVWSRKKNKINSHWIDSAHSGYKKLFGLIHSRKIHLDTKELILRGQDYFAQTTNDYSLIPKKYYIRFHLHPDVNVSLTGSKKKAILKLKDGNGWEFLCSESSLEIGESIYLGEGEKIIKNSHLLISNTIIPEKKIKWLFKLIRS